MEKQNQVIEKFKIDWDKMAERWTEQHLQRNDLFAIQLQDGRYACVKSRFHPRLMRLHLQGKLTLGGYLLDPHSRARQVILDADDEASFDQLKSLSRRWRCRRCLPTWRPPGGAGTCGCSSPSPSAGGKRAALGDA